MVEIRAKCDLGTLVSRKGGRAVHQSSTDELNMVNWRRFSVSIVSRSILNPPYGGKLVDLLVAGEAVAELKA
jgi:hypothetical protein